MDAIDALLSRTSPLRFASEAPDEAALQTILATGLRAADHGRLRPWRFMVVRGAARERLGDLFAEALKSRTPDASEALLAAERAKALRAPIIVIIVAAIRDNPKIPEIEQVVAAGAAAQNMLVAAHALGLGAFWRTGAPAYDPLVRRRLGLTDRDTLVGFLYLGTVAAPGIPKKADPAGVVEEWNG